MTLSLEELLARDGTLVYRTRGRSMEPMLRQNRDLVVVRVPSSRLQKYDVALYRRGKNYVLHRVIRVLEDRYLIRGDNTFALETVPDGDVIGVLTAFTRKGKQISACAPGYRFYARFWNGIYPLRALYSLFRRLAVRTAGKLGILPLLRRILGKGGPAG